MAEADIPADGAEMRIYLYAALAVLGAGVLWYGATIVTKAAKYDEAQQEIAQANQQIQEVVNEYGRLQEQYEQEGRRRHQAQLAAARWEREAAAVSAGGDAAAYNRKLCEVLTGIQGADLGETPDAPGSACDEAARGERKYSLTERSATNLLINLNRLRDFVEAVERLR